MDAEVPLDFLHVDDVVSISHPEVDGLVRCLVQVLHERQRRGSQAMLHRHQFTELEKPDAKRIVIVNALEELEVDHRRG
jgi:hypothetical protein